MIDKQVKFKTNILLKFSNSNSNIQKYLSLSLFITIIVGLLKLIFDSYTFLEFLIFIQLVLLLHVLKIYLLGEPIYKDINSYISVNNSKLQIVLDDINNEPYTIRKVIYEVNFDKFRYITFDPNTNKLQLSGDIVYYGIFNKLSNARLKRFNAIVLKVHDIDGDLVELFNYIADICK